MMSTTKMAMSHMEDPRLRRLLREEQENGHSLQRHHIPGVSPEGLVSGCVDDEQTRDPHLNSGKLKNLTIMLIKMLD